MRVPSVADTGDQVCLCEVREDYDGERIRTHCKEHCPRVQGGDWDYCKGC